MLAGPPLVRAEACQPTAAKTLEQKDHLLEEESGGKGMEG